MKTLRGFFLWLRATKRSPTEAGWNQKIGSETPPDKSGGKHKAPAEAGKKKVFGKTREHPGITITNLQGR
jgi:hypothetical protein